MIDQPSTLTLVTALNDTLERICPSRVAVVIEPSVSAQWWTYSFDDLAAGENIASDGMEQEDWERPSSAL
jgi:hypothetical protein